MKRFASIHVRARPILVTMVVLLVGCSANTGHASQRDAFGKPRAHRQDSELSDLLWQLPVGAMVRVSNESFDLAGDLLRISNDEIVVGVAPLDDATVRVEDIDRLWLTDGDHRKRGALWGVLLGGTAGATFFGIAAGAYADDLPTGIVFGSVVGVAAGGAVGAILGWRAPRWGLVYERR